MTSPYETPDEFEPVTTAAARPRPRFLARKKAAASGLDAAKQDIAYMAQTLTAVTEQLAALDTAATSPAAIRRATLNDVLDVLREVGETSAYVAVRRMIREGY